VALRREEIRAQERGSRRSWLRVTQADRAELEDYLAEAAGLGC